MLKEGTKGKLTKDANLKYDSYGSARPDGKSTQTLKSGTSVEITKVIDNPKPGQTHSVQINNAGWIEPRSVFVMPESVKGIIPGASSAASKPAATASKPSITINKPATTGNKPGATGTKPGSSAVKPGAAKTK